MPSSHRKSEKASTCQRVDNDNKVANDGASLSYYAPTLPTYDPHRRIHKAARKDGKPEATLALSADEVLYLETAWEITAQKGCQLNYSIDISFAVPPDADVKRQLYDSARTIWRGIEAETGYPAIGLVVFERERGGKVHAHNLVHAIGDGATYVDRRGKRSKKHSGGGLQIKVIKGIDKGKLGYITKQCHGRKHPFSGYPTSKGNFITGQRYALSPSLAAMVEHLPTPRAARVCLPKQSRQLEITAQSVSVMSVTASAVHATFTFEPSGQGCLFTPTETPVTLQSLKQGKLPPEVVIDLEQKRRERGLTQEAVAAAIGVSRPQYANAVAGRFGLSREPLALLKVLLAA